MTPLFDLVRLLSVSSDRDISLRSKVTVEKYSWHEKENISTLALSCSNAYLLVWRYTHSQSHPPSVRQIPWTKDNIQHLTFDPTGTWLLVLSQKLSIVPVSSLMNSTCCDVPGWSTDDVTVMDLLPKHHQCTVAVWWHTFDESRIAIVGSKKGVVYFVDLLLRTIITKIQVSFHITALELLNNDMNTQLLITLKDGSQQKLLLENKNIPSQKLDEDDVEKLGYHDVTAITSILNITEESRSMFQPVSLQQFTQSMVMSPQVCKGHNYVAVHDYKLSTFRVFNGKTDNTAYHTYKLPVGCSNIIYSDKLIFALSIVKGKKLCVISCPLSEIEEIEQSLENDSVLQQFSLSNDEKIVGFSKKTFPYFWHEKQEESAYHSLQHQSLEYSMDTVSNMSVGTWACEGVYGIDVGQHTVLDGCILVTSKAVYELRPRISPERQFLQYTVEDNNTKMAEQLAKSLDLDVSSLFEMSAEYKLSVGEFSLAMKLFNLSKCSPMKRVAAFACYGCIPEILTYVKHSLLLPYITPEEKTKLSDLAVYAYVHQSGIQRDDTHAKIHKQFRDFLKTNMDFDRPAAMKLFAKKKMYEILFLIARLYGYVYEALDILITQGETKLDQNMAKTLALSGYFPQILKVGNGIFLRSLSLELAVKLLSKCPKIAITQTSYIESVLSNLSHNNLLDLSRVFDPSTHLMKMTLSECFTKVPRNASYGSLSSFTSEIIEAHSTNTVEYGCSLLMLFVRIVLKLNAPKITIPSLLDMSSFSFEYKKTIAPSDTRTQDHMITEPFPIGCGYRHTVVIKNKDVYSWGKQHGGRLGLGDEIMNGKIMLPSPVTSLNNLQIAVLSVSCGKEHTLALTQHGVYSWGSSRYGQLGVNLYERYIFRPVVIEALAPMEIVAISCGQYHSIFLDEFGSVYTCGWGVHGQLGHGNPNDQIKPCKINLLYKVTKIAGGYCHSVVLTEEGDVYTFGCGLFGQLGHGLNSKSSVPVKITLPYKVINIASGYFHSLALTVKDVLYTWGSHPHNLRQIAHSRKQDRQFRYSTRNRRSGKMVNYLSPSIVDTRYVNGKIMQMSCGAYHSALLTTEGEVYVWGRSTDSQLGTPYKTDQRLPSLLTSIREHTMTYIQCGSEYTVAMDTDNLVWVWGKNDCGQIGLTPAESGKKVKSHDKSRDGSQPVILRSLPSTKLARSVSDVRRWAVENNQHETVEDQNATTRETNYETYSCLPYHTNIIVPFLEEWSDKCDLQKICQLSIEENNWLAAAHVYAYQQNYPMAMIYHLDAITDYIRTAKDVNQCDVLSVASEVVEHYYSQIKIGKMMSPAGVLPYRNMITKVFEFWLNNCLSWTKLEEILSMQLKQFAAILAVVLFTNNVPGSSLIDVNVNEKTSMSRQNVYFEKLSPKFKLKILEENIQQIQSNEFVCDLLETELKLESNSELKLENPNRLVPFERLWQEITQNLKKDWEKSKTLILTSRDINAVKQQITSDVSLPQGDKENVPHIPSSKTEITAFTCGHNCNKEMLKQEVKRVFHDQDFNVINQLHNLYIDNKFICLPCPKCLSISA